MDNQKVAKELVKLAKALTAGVTRSDIISLASKAGGNVASEVLGPFTAFMKEFAGSGSGSKMKHSEIVKVLETALSKVKSIEKKYRKQIDEEMEK